VGLGVVMVCSWLRMLRFAARQSLASPFGTLREL
jgi:hypothetical protein